MSKTQRDDESATPDQIRAQEKREAAQKRADAAARDSAKQAWPSDAPKGRRASDKSETAG